MKKWALWLAPGAAVLLLDRLVKIWTEGVECQAIPGVIAICSVHNSGMALGLFQGRTVGILLLSLGLIGLCAWLLCSMRPQGLAAAAVSMVAGGALGNMLDRVFLGYVMDMFDLEFMDFYVFNVADVAVVAGAALCGLSLLLRPGDWRKAA